MMKKLLALLLAGVLALSMSACCCCLPTEDFELPDFDIPDFELPNVQRPSAENSKPTGDVIIVVPSDPDKDNSDPGNDPSGEIQRPTEPERPSEMPTIKPQPSVPSRKEVYRCVLTSYQDSDGNPWFQQKLQLKDGFITYVETNGYDGELRRSYISYDWDARTATITSDDPDSDSQTFTWDEQGQIVQIVAQHDGNLMVVRNSYTSFGEIAESRTFVNGELVNRVAYEYNENGQMTWNAYYDSNGDITESSQIDYNKHGDHIAELWWEDGVLISDYRYTYTYDEEGRKLTETAVFGDSGRFIYKYSYNYNAEGLLESEYSFDEEGFPNYWYEYTYNEDGLQTQLAQFTPDGLSDTYITEYTKDGHILRQSRYSHFDGNAMLQNVDVYDYRTVYVTELEDTVQNHLFDMITGWGL